MQETKEKLKAVIAELFKCAAGDLTDDTGPGDIPGWDSLGRADKAPMVWRAHPR